MKKLVSVVLSLMLILAISGCADYSNIVGHDIIMEARYLYSNLNSGHLVVKDDDTGLITQEFTFTYDSNGILMYSYFGTDGETKYYEYHNGSEYMYTENGEWKTLTNQSENFVRYSKEQRNNLTSDITLMFIPKNITNSKEEVKQDERIYTYTYDASSLSTQQLGETGTLKEYSTTFTIDKNGYCTKLQQNGTIDKDGKIGKVNYTMIIDKMNDVAEVTKPVAEF